MWNQELANDRSKQCERVPDAGGEGTSTKSFGKLGKSAQRSKAARHGNSLRIF